MKLLALLRMARKYVCWACVAGKHDSCAGAGCECDCWMYR